MAILWYSIKILNVNFEIIFSGVFGVDNSKIKLFYQTNVSNPDFTKNILVPEGAYLPPLGGSTNTFNGSEFTSGGTLVNVEPFDIYGFKSRISKIGFYKFVEYDMFGFSETTYTINFMVNEQNYDYVSTADYYFEIEPTTSPLSDIELTFVIEPNFSLITLPMTDFTGTIDWGNGTVKQYTSTNGPFFNYLQTGIYTVKIKNTSSCSSFGPSFRTEIFEKALIEFKYINNVQSITNLSSLFANCTRSVAVYFANDVTSNVQDMSAMFYKSTNITAIDQVSNKINLNCLSCTTLKDFLRESKNVGSFLNLTNTNNVIDMSGMFFKANYNNQIVLNCLNCITLKDFLREASNFNSSVNLSNTSNVTDMSYMFYKAINFNNNIDFDCSSCTTLQSFLDEASKFNSELKLSNTGKVKAMNGMFSGCKEFNKPITLDCTSCTTLQAFLRNASVFNETLTLSNTSSVLSMAGMFSNCKEFNKEINLDSSACTTFSFFLSGATKFNNLNKNLNLTTTNAVDMSAMFYECSSFNQNISFDCTSCTNLGSFLYKATSFNSKLELSNTLNVKNMSSMLQECTSFNQPINLECNSCINLGSFLYKATSFNSLLNLLNTSIVTNMSSMLQECTSFNQPIKLDCSSCKFLSNFLNGSSNFNNFLDLTPIPVMENANDMLKGVLNLSTENYSNLLILWGSNEILKPSINLVASGIKYNALAQPYRNKLTSSPNNWNIQDAGINQIPTVIDEYPQSLTKIYGNGLFTLSYKSNNKASPVYTSDNENVATINQDGIVRLVGPGNASLKVFLPEYEIYTSGTSECLLTVVQNTPENPVVVSNPSDFASFLETPGAGFCELNVSSLEITSPLINDDSSTLKTIVVTQKCVLVITTL